uniref:Uncharacterized protein n=1 Tax=Oryza glumipatula TaxID=40148 RepID=A0A0D9YDI4_9ORYZ
MAGRSDNGDGALTKCVNQEELHHDEHFSFIYKWKNKISSAGNARLYYHYGYNFEMISSKSELRKQIKRQY